MLDELTQISANRGFYVQRGNKIIEIREYGIGKSKAALKLLPPFPQNVYVFGDDTTDEDMFRELDQSVTSIKIGKSETIAKYRLKHPDEVKIWMQSLINYLKGKSNESA